MLTLTGLHTAARRRTGKSLAFLDAPLGHTAEGGKRPGLDIEQHLVALARIGHQPEGARGAQLQMCHLRLVYTPPTTMPSSLQSNWNDSPNSKLSSTNALVASLPESNRHARMKSVTALWPPR